MKYVVQEMDPGGSFELIGPFNSEQEAIAWLDSEERPGPNVHTLLPVYDPETRK